MQYNLRLRSDCISDKKGNRICLEFQRDIDKLAPSTKVKSLIANATFSQVEQELLVFLRQISPVPPFVIAEEFFCDVIFSKIAQLNFCFIKKPNGGLRRIDSLPFQAKPYSFKRIKPSGIKIYIKSILANSACVESYYDFDGVLIPLWYDFLILRDNALYTMDTMDIKIKANSIVEDISALKFSYDELNALKGEFEVLIKQNKTKSVSFSRTSSGFLSFDKEVESPHFYNELLEAYLKGKNYVEFDDKLIIVRQEHFSEQSAMQILRESQIDKTNIIDFLDKIKNMRHYPCKEELDALHLRIKATLKPYQIEGVLWLCNLYKNECFGGLLADDMGLGKTLQTICFLVVNNIKKILIIAPATLVQNWKSEILKYTYIKEEEISLDITEANITILSYESARSKINKLKDYHLLILDESQKIKNDKTQIFSAITRISRDFTIIISGTPIENSLLDLWNMMSAINANFKWLYTNKIAPFTSDTKSAIDMSVKLLSPFIKRREKDEVLNLPARETKTIFIDFTDSEREAYNRIYKIFASAFKSGLSARANFVILEGLLRVRQFCSLHRIIPKSLYNCQNLADSKLKVLLDLVNGIIKNKQKVLIFSQFTSSLSVLKEVLNHTQFLYLDGSISKTNRAKIIADFQASDSPYSVFLISLKAGGVGLNLTNAQNAIILEPWFNPAIEEQAFSRIHRIGQDKEVRIYRLLYANSIESQIQNLINHKLSLSQGVNAGLLELAKELFA